jgi:4-oxalocrotonate tautomerase
MEEPMPVVIVMLWEGRSVEEKRNLTEAITEAMREHLGTDPNSLHIAIQDYPRENWSSGGVLAIDKKP